MSQRRVYNTYSIAWLRNVDSNAIGKRKTQDGAGKYHSKRKKVGGQTTTKIARRQETKTKKKMERGGAAAGRPAREEGG